MDPLAIAVVILVSVAFGVGAVVGEAYGHSNTPKATWQDGAIKRMWRYLQHTPQCEADFEMLSGCTCGLASLVELIKAAEKP